MKIERNITPSGSSNMGKTYKDTRNKEYGCEKGKPYPKKRK